MWRLSLVFLCLFLYLSGSGQTGKLYDDRQISEIYIYIDADTLQYVIDNKINDEYFRSAFVFNDLAKKDTLLDVGFRLKGNTSLNNQKKSFKLSFNTFEKGRKFQGVKKLNLLANVNDPTMIRQKLYYHIYGKCGLLTRRAAFVRVFINDEYRGLYTNIEEPDDEWIEDLFESDKGNLYKCTYPANLVYHGDDQDYYKNIFNDPTTRAYDLKTNEEEDDYSGLVDLIRLINKPQDNDFAENAKQKIDIRSVLKSYAVDIVTGNWDDYFYLKNNYYLYHEPATGQFHYAAYDTDNSFGIDWLGIDWGVRDISEWHHSTEPRPLITSLLSIPEYNQLFIQYLDSVTRYVVPADSLFPVIDRWHNLITDAAASDPYYSKDYGYDINDFHDSYTRAIDSHTPYGLKPFIERRSQHTLQQINSLERASAKPELFQIVPNPTSSYLIIIGQFASKIQSVKIFNQFGAEQPFNYLSADKISVRHLKAGVYILQIRANDRFAMLKFIKL